MITTPLSALPASADVVVIGSGAAGLITAVRAADSGASVIVLEKAELLGGTTAVGGGVAWLPASDVGAAAGYADSAEAATAYLTAATGGSMSTAEVAWYVRQAPRVASYLHEQTQATLVPLARPDYRLEWDGATEGGRSLDNAAFDVGSVPGLREAIRPSSYFPLLTMSERDSLNGAAPDQALLAARAADGVRTMGGALVASLLLSALERGAVVSAAARVTGLVAGAGSEAGAGPDAGAGSGAPAAWRIEINDGEAEITASTVVIASGGFEWSEELQRAFLPHPITPISAPSNEGDGLRLGLAAGATVAEMTTFWGIPVITPPQQLLDGKQSGRMGNVEMTLPGSITVGADGKRFVNEALNYHDVSRVFGAIDPHRLTEAGEPAWLVFDQAFFDRYPVAGATEPTEWMTVAASLPELARAIGVDAAGLVAQVERFNADAATGVDTEFGRGSTPQDRFLGDDAVQPNPCLAPLATGPFYAVRLHCGTLGTSGGLATDEHGRVLGHAGTALPGLYAAGNAAASLFRGAYPGGGATLGSALVRGFSAGEHIAATHAAG